MGYSTTVYVEGDATMNTYTDAEGKNRSSLSIIQSMYSLRAPRSKHYLLLRLQICNAKHKRNTDTAPSQGTLRSSAVRPTQRNKTPSGV